MAGVDGKRKSSEYKVRSFIRIDGEYQVIEELSPELRMVIMKELNERAMLSAGYVPTIVKERE